MDTANPIKNRWFWLFYYGLPFVFKYAVRIATVCCLSLYDIIPIKSLVSPLFEFVLGQSQRFITGSELSEVDGHGSATEN